MGGGGLKHLDRPKWHISVESGVAQVLKYKFYPSILKKTGQIVLPSLTYQTSPYPTPASD